MSDITRDLNDYGFSTEIRVRLSETDAVGIVFFGSFALYFDVGRMDYLAQLGLHHMDGAVKDLIPGAVVHQESHFHSPARYNDILVVHVRLARIGTTSYQFQFLLQQKRTREVVCTGSLTLAWLDEDFKPMRIPETFRQTVSGFEGEKLEDTSS